MAFDKLKAKIPFPMPPPPPELTSPSPEPSEAPDFSSTLKYKPKRGGLSLDLIASIQKTYADDANKNNPQAKPAKTPQLGLEDGWGGKGR